MSDAAQLGLFGDELQPGEYDLPDAAKRSACASCRKSIAWVQTKSGASMPLDVETSRTLSNGRVVALSHFATCPHANAHRKKPLGKS